MSASSTASWIFQKRVEHAECPEYSRTGGAQVYNLPQRAPMRSSDFEVSIDSSP